MWQKDLSFFSIQPSASLCGWLQKPGNLGEGLRQTCAKLTLSVINQQMEIALPDEWGALRLDVNTPRCYVRRILLHGDGVPLTYGRVVVPEATYYHLQAKLDALGEKLIGETMLYNDPCTVRSEFEYNCLKPSHPLLASLAMKSEAEMFWARRSLFELHSRDKLLITEVFLKELPDLTTIKNPQ